MKRRRRRRKRKKKTVGQMMVKYRSLDAVRIAIPFACAVLQGIITSMLQSALPGLLSAICLSVAFERSY